MSPNSSLFTIRLSFPKEYEVLIDRILEVSVLFATVHLLIHIAPPAATGLFAANFWQMLLFAALGFCAYYLVFKRIVHIECVGNEDTQSPYRLRSNPIDAFRSWLKSKL